MYIPFSQQRSNMCASGRKLIIVSLYEGLCSPNWTRTALMPAITFWCVNITPFGLPVVPDVYDMVHRSVDLGGTSGWFFWAPSRSTSSNLSSSTPRFFALWFVVCLVSFITTNFRRHLAEWKERLKIIKRKKRVNW